MRSELIFTNLRCNQNCTYCTFRRATDDLRAIRPQAIRAEIERAVAAGAREIVFSGGEPTMRADLAALIAHARACGAEQVTLETNATLIDQARAATFKEAGLTLARVNFTATGELLDRITRDPGGHLRTEAGLRALSAADVPIELVVVAVRSTVDTLGDLPSHVFQILGPAHSLRGFMIRVPVDSPDPSELLPYEAIVPALRELEKAARAAGVMVKLAPDHTIPPCVFPQTLHIAHLFSLTPGTRRRDSHQQLEICAKCEVNDRCSGIPTVYLDRFGAPSQMEPITEDRVRRRLSLISSVEEQIRRELVQPNRYTSPRTGAVIEEALIRINFHCNQSCRFCFVSTHLPAASDEEVRRSIIEAGKAGKQITLTGGEPTLNPRLVEYVELAKVHSHHPVAVQSNAVRLADPELTRRLVEAGMISIQVSLHATEAELSDAITGAPGTFEKTVAGIDNLQAYESIKTVVNFVITQQNYLNLVPFVRFVASRWPRVFLNFSFVAASSDVVPKEKALVPRYSDVLPQIFAAMEEARRLNLDYGGFESMCGIPLCLVPTEERWFLMHDIPAGYDGGEFIKPPVCESCSLVRKCYGLRRGYYDLYGADELQAVLDDPLQKAAVK